MKWFHAARARLRLLAPRAAESRISDEIRFHIEMETEKNIALGMTPEAARLKALSDTEPAGLLQVSADVDPDATEGTDVEIVSANTDGPMKLSIKA